MPNYSVDHVLLQTSQSKKKAKSKNKISNISLNFAAALISIKSDNAPNIKKFKLKSFKEQLMIYKCLIFTKCFY